MATQSRYPQWVQPWKITSRLLILVSFAALLTVLVLAGSDVHSGNLVCGSAFHWRQANATFGPGGEHIGGVDTHAIHACREAGRAQWSRVRLIAAVGAGLLGLYASLSLLRRAWPHEDAPRARSR